MAVETTATRVSITFPVNDAEEQRAFALFKDFLIAHPLGRDPAPTSVTGFTFTVEVHEGYYWSQEAENWIPDSVLYLFIDFELSLEDARLPDVIRRLKERFFEAYEDMERRQEDVWCVSIPLTIW